MYKLAAYYVSGNNSSRQSFNNYHNSLDLIIPTWWELKADGSIQENIVKDEKLLFKLMKKEKIIPLLQNHGLKSSVSNQFLDDKNAQKRAIKNLIKLIEKYSLVGININLEGVKLANKDKFTTFITNLGKKLQKKAIKLGLSIPAKTENTMDLSWSGAYDYQALGKSSQEMLIMAYDFHWAGGPPGPVAPLTWVQDVIDFALMEIPLEKIFLGIPFYGYDWLLESNQRAKGLSYRQIENLAKKYNSNIEWDQESCSPYLRYKNESGQHEVWFENKESVRKKIKLVKEYQLAGAVFWRLGLEDERIWSLDF